MKTYVSILRGINVGGHNMIRMEALRKLYVGLGLSDVQSYIQSGNLVFRAKDGGCSKIESKITTAIKKEFGLDVPVMVLELRELKKIANENPFAKNSSKDPAFLHVSFLSGEPEIDLIEKIDSRPYHPHEFSCKGRAIYLYCPSGYGKTKLNNGFFENKLKLTSTTRNWKTVIQLISMAEIISK